MDAEFGCDGFVLRAKAGEGNRIKTGLGIRMADFRINGLEPCAIAKIDLHGTGAQQAVPEENGLAWMNIANGIRKDPTRSDIRTALGIIDTHLGKITVLMPLGSGHRQFFGIQAWPIVADHHLRTLHFARIVQAPVVGVDLLARARHRTRAIQHNRLAGHSKMVTTGDR